MRVVLLESGEPSLPFVRELLASIADEVRDASLDAIPAFLDGDANLLVIATAVWTDADTLACARVDDARTGSPLLAISGRAPLALRTAALRAGADELMTIPFEVDELAARAFALLRLSTRGGALRAGVFVVEPIRRRVLVSGAPVALTRSEHDVLVALIASAGVVVPRRALASRVGSSASSDSNIVDVLVSRIREKLGAHAGAIETVRGVGYRFRAG